MLLYRLFYLFAWILALASLTGHPLASAATVATCLALTIPLCLWDVARADRWFVAAWEVAWLTLTCYYILATAS